MFKQRHKSGYYQKLDPSQYEKALKLWYKSATGEVLDLENPKTFNEKIQWMKLYDSTPLKTRLADKYLVREWVAEQIGEEHLIPLLGVWDTFDEIDFAKLPQQFVLKANHGCGWNIIVKDKDTFDPKEAKEKMDQWMKEDYGLRSDLELHYMNMPPKIIAEEFIQNMDDLYDYKIFCYHGKVEFICVTTDRNTGLKNTFYSINWEALPMSMIGRGSRCDLEKPKNLEKMIFIAEQLSHKFSFVRVDLYEVNDFILFGEMTFTPTSGNMKWEPQEMNLQYGNLINLPEKSPIPTKLI